MSCAKWDPANLFQISYEIGNLNAPIFCVGESKAKPGNPRCRWTIPESDCASIRDLLRILSSTEPQSVSAKGLHRIASLCLCDGYHKSQANEIMDRWIRVTKLAAQQRSLLTGSSTTSSGDKSAQQYLAEAETAKKELQETLGKYEKLNERADSLNKLIGERERREHKLHTTMSLMKGRMDKLEGEKDKANKELMLATEKAHGLEASSSRLEEQKHAVTEKLDELRHELLVAREKTHQLEAKCSRMSEEMGALKTESACLDKKNSTILTAIKQMEAERDSARDSQQKTSAELVEIQRSNATLQDEVQSLQFVIESLRESIATCWLHRLRAWIIRFSLSKT